MEGVPATGFATMARFLAAESREAGLVVPAFRSPPRVAGVARTIRHLRDGAVVAVQLRGRDAAAVAADMIEGIVVANRLDATRAESVRRRLARAIAPVEIDLVAIESAESGAGPNLTPHARVAERQTQAA